MKATIHKLSKAEQHQLLARLAKEFGGTFEALEERTRTRKLYQFEELIFELAVANALAGEC